MTEYSETAVLVWPVILPEVNVAHTTVLYLGEVADIDVPKERIIEVLASLPLNISSETEILVTGTEIFGDETKVKVAVLDDSVLSMEQRFIKAALEVWAGVKDAGSYPNYRPHVTLGKVGENVIPTPESVTLKPLELWWGDEQIVVQ